MSGQPTSDSRLKQRLVGAIVLVSLAVIFIPMMLSDRGGFDGLITSSNIPPQPEHGRRMVEIPLHEPLPRPVSKPVTTVVVDEYTNDLPEDFVPANPESGMTFGVDSNLPARTDPKPDSKPVTKLQAEEKKSSKQVKKAVSGSVESWVVQLGSFSDRANALALRNRIRTKKYSAYVEAVTTNRGTIYRVRVGPERSRSKAEKLQSKLHKVFNLNGMVLTHKDKKQ